MELLMTKQFNGIELACYKADNKDDGFWATREQIGTLLGYAEPREAIKNIHSRNRERLDKFSRGAQIDTTFGGTQNATIYLSAMALIIVMLDTGKKHSYGAPVRQLKWHSGIIPLIEEQM